MDYKYIEQLLERYWKCETSLEEESILRSFFAQKDVPVSLLPYRDLFLEEQKQGEAELGSDFDEKVLAQIGEEAKPAQVKRVRPLYLLRPFFKAAACIGIMLAFALAIQQAYDKSNQEAQQQQMALQQAEQQKADTAIIGNVQTAEAEKIAVQDSSATLTGQEVSNQ